MCQNGKTQGRRHPTGMPSRHVVLSNISKCISRQELCRKANDVWGLMLDA